MRSSYIIFIMLIKDVMTKKVITIPLHFNFLQILRLFVKQNITGAPVVDKKGKVLGIISEKDLIFALFPNEKEFYKNMEFYMTETRREDLVKDVGKLKAEKLMRKNFLFVGPDDHILTACASLLLHNIRRLLVMDKGKLVGIVTTNDVFKNYLSHFTTH